MMIQQINQDISAADWAAHFGEMAIGRLTALRTITDVTTFDGFVRHAVACTREAVRAADAALTAGEVRGRS